MSFSLPRSIETKKTIDFLPVHCYNSITVLRAEHTEEDEDIVK